MASACRVGVGAVLAVGLLALSAPVGVAESGGGSAARPDYSTLVLRGNGMAQDSFSLALQAAARLLGRDADYETIAAMTTSVFSPAITPGEDCTSWWHVDARYLATAADLQPVSELIGVRLRRLDVPVFKGDGKDEEEGRRYRRDVAKLLAQTMDAGAVIVVSGGWEPTGGPHGFVPWGWAGIVTEARPDGTILGACLNGEKDNPLRWFAPMWAVSAGEVTATPAQASRATLRQAVSRIRGTGRFQRGESSVYGLDAMDLWIRQMEQVAGFCAQCQERDGRGWSDARDNGMAFHDRAKVASSYLRELVSAFPEAARPHLASAAAHYDRIARLLTPALTGEGGEKYEQFIGNLDKQRAHAEAVLRPVRSELSAAADDMDKALAVPLREARLLRGVPAGKGDGNEFVRGLEVILDHAGTPVDYDTLMGDLGLAFILQASDQVPRYNGALDVGWWPLDPACIPTYLDFVGRTAGRRIDFLRLGAVSETELPQVFRERALPRAEATLNNGSPFLAIDCCWKVVTGCDGGEPPLLGFLASAGSAEPARFRSDAWAFAFLGEQVPRLERHAADREALRHAVALSRDEVAMPCEFVTGQKAYALWAQALRDTEHLGEARWHWNTVRHLTLNRTSATAYLRGMVARQPAAAPHLLATAACYEDALARLKEADFSEAALMSSNGREKLAALVEGIARIEADAVGELQKAVAAMPAR